MQRSWRRIARTWRMENKDKLNGVMKECHLETHAGKHNCWVRQDPGCTIWKQHGRDVDLYSVCQDNFDFRRLDKMPLVSFLFCKCCRQKTAFWRDRDWRSQSATVNSEERKLWLSAKKHSEKGKTAHIGVSAVTKLPEHSVKCQLCKMRHARFDLVGQHLVKNWNV